MGIITGTIGNYFWSKIDSSQKPENYLDIALNKTSEWIIDNNGKVYFYKKNPELKILIDNPEDVLSGRFKKFPYTQNDCIQRVHVEFKGQKYFSWNFMSLYNHQIFVPVPDIGFEDKEGTKFYDFYDLSKREFYIFKIIGNVSFSREIDKMNGLKKVAEILNIHVI